MSDQTKFFQCECTTHAIGVDKYDEAEIYLTYWCLPGAYNNNFRKRLELIWNIIRGQKHIYYDVLLTKQQAKELGEYLVELGESNTDFTEDSK